MTWQTCTCSSMAEFRSVYSAVADMINAGQRVDIQLREHQNNRKNAQNALQFHWFREMEMQGDNDAEWYRAFYKLTVGVPIARESSEGFRELYDRVIRPHDFETKLSLMGWAVDLPVTREFTTKEMTRYLSGVLRDATGKGIRLSTGSDMYNQAMGERK